MGMFLRLLNDGSANLRGGMVLCFLKNKEKCGFEEPCDCCKVLQSAKAQISLSIGYELNGCKAGLECFLAYCGRADELLPEVSAPVGCSPGPASATLRPCIIALRHTRARCDVARLKAPHMPGVALDGSASAACAVMIMSLMSMDRPDRRSGDCNKATPAGRFERVSGTHCPERKS
jgi:hypothetical protein